MRSASSACLRGDVADVALDHLVAVHQIDVADELHGDLPPIGGFQRHVVVANVPLLLQFREVVLVGDGVLEAAEFPDLLSDHCLVRETQHFDQERIDIHNQFRLGIEDQNAVLGRLKEPAIAKFRSDQRLGRVIPVSWLS